MDSSFLIYVLKVAAQITLLSLMFYRLYVVFHQSKAVVLIYVFLAYGFVLLSSHYLDLRVLEDMLKYLFVPFFIVVVIIFQDEIKSSVNSSQSSIKMIRRRENFVSAAELKAMLVALYSLADMKRGALIVIRKNDTLDDKIRNSYTRLDCDITSNIIITIFSYDTPLHDGALIIDRNRISLAGCVLPSSSKGVIKSSDYKPFLGENEGEESESGESDAGARKDSHREDKIFGTRHRAAIGITEVSDAIAIVVSEESRALSICYGGDIYYDLSQDDAAVFLGQLIGYEDKKE
ncbi:MAG TPA: hypothetical protein DCO86_03020 [Spirochaetaceae bacterium]|nr:hypothetical protein [Spirochaetaceae bacterium]